MTADKLILTNEGLISVKGELDKLYKKRPHLVNRISRARTEGDLAENSDYINAREDLRFLDERIAELEEVLSKAKIVKKSKKDGRVAIGSKVTLKVNGNRQVFLIVGDWEADPLKGKISYTSPLGKALIGKNVGDKVEVSAPAGKVYYEILRIE